MKEFAIALRPELYARDEVLRFVNLLDSAPCVSHVFFPDIPNGLESIELSMAALVTTNRVRVGSGVVRLGEHDPKTFGRRLRTIQFLSKNRFVLGIGTGSPGKSPGIAMEKLFGTLDSVKDSFANSSGHDSAPVFPDVLCAALRSHMAEMGMKYTNGLLLNFCSPEYAKRLISGSRHSSSDAEKTIACYIKLFYSANQSDAEKSLVREFSKYDALPPYHKMFERDGIADSISDLKDRMSKGQPLVVPDDLKRICLANPSEDQLLSHLEKYEKSGVDLPCVYPYFADDARTEFKTSTIRSIAKLSSL